MITKDVSERLAYLRSQIEAEQISYSEIAELQSLAEHIDPSDVVLLEWAGVPEFPERAQTVILRRWRGRDGSVIALFPDDPDPDGLINAYEHIGQHGPAHYPTVIERTVPASAAEPEVKDLLAELHRIGYGELIIRQRRARPATKKRTTR